MSTDFQAVCDSCKLSTHVGQIAGGVPAFGWNSSATGSQVAVAAWVYLHAYHDPGVRIEPDQSILGRPSDDYTDVELEDWVKEGSRWVPPKEGSP